jgi:hypothetical protein
MDYASLHVANAWITAAAKTPRPAGRNTADRGCLRNPLPQRLTENEIESYQWLESYAAGELPSSQPARKLGGSRALQTSGNHVSASAQVRPSGQPRVLRGGSTHAIAIANSCAVSNLSLTINRTGFRIGIVEAADPEKAEAAAVRIAGLSCRNAADPHPPGPTSAWAGSLTFRPRGYFTSAPTSCGTCRRRC